MQIFPIDTMKKLCDKFFSGHFNHFVFQRPRLFCYFLMRCIYYLELFYSRVYSSNKDMCSGLSEQKSTAHQASGNFSLQSEKDWNRVFVLMTHYFFFLLAPVTCNACFHSRTTVCVNYFTINCWIHFRKYHFSCYFLLSTSFSAFYFVASKSFIRGKNKNCTLIR